MSDRKKNRAEASATTVSATDDRLTVGLMDGRTISVPIAWYPRLAYGTPRERENCQIIGAGHGIHWPDLDEDLSVEGLLEGRPSGERQASLKRWLQQRGQAPNE